MNTLWRGLSRHSFVRFALVGAANTALSMALANGLHYVAGVGRFGATSAGYVLGVFTSFVLNKYWTFAHRPGGGGIRRQLPMFVALNLVGLGLSNLLIGLIGDSLPYWMAYCVVVLVVMQWNYWSMRSLVYKAAPNA